MATDKAFERYTMIGKPELFLTPTVTSTVTIQPPTSTSTIGHL